MREAVAASVHVSSANWRSRKIWNARKALAEQGCGVAESTADEHAQFKKAVEPLWAERDAIQERALFEMMPA